ncbi:MAG TPA: dTDP-4-dehydrorhamnose 3,5-epimerase [Tepidisphaeraceae bacterium]|jgi:dTDP-4-dehydrorhamnose 3,5-epimerase|nr:dTDP-4-dehydrorhamnose 3,5-epimerase [Tepidisphaeraceae bacterium]
MNDITLVPTGIDGARLTKLTVWEDERGSFLEAFRASWFVEKQRWVQWNVSRSTGSVVRGLHFHKLQTDYWMVVAGKLQVALVDLRPKSPTFKEAKCLTLDAAEPQGLYIPPGVLHGYRIAEEGTIMYLVDVEYTGKDEYGVRWNDPALGLPAEWYEGPEPSVSKRDATAPLLKELKERA